VNAEEFRALSEKARLDLASLYLRAQAEKVDLGRILEGAIKNPSTRNTARKSMPEILAECISAKRAANLSKQYAKHLQLLVGQFLRGREAMPIGEVTTAQLEEWANSRGWSPQTRATVLARLSAFFGFAKQRKYIAENPADALEKVKIHKRPPRILSAERADQLIRHATKDMLGYFVLALFAGVRPEETEKVRWEQIDLERGHLWLNAPETKMGKRRLVHLSPNAIEWLRLVRKKKGAVSPSHSTIRRRRRELCKALRLTWQADILRHTAASMMLARDQDAAKVSLELGHSVKVLLTVYRELVTREEAEEFFQIAPVVAAVA
jgi:integrase